MAPDNLCVTLLRRPEGAAEAGDFACVRLPMPEPGAGQLLVRTDGLSLDPYMASAIQGRHMTGVVRPGDVMPGEIVGTVMASRHDRFAVGDRVITRGGWRSYCVAEGDAVGDPQGSSNAGPQAERIEPQAGIPASAYLGVLGMPGLTAYALMLRCLRPVPGDTVAILAATGAVGSAAGQIARIMGARTVAVVGSADKARHAREVLGYDDAVIRTDPELASALQRACPEGIDALVSNDSGPSLAVLIGALSLRARVALIGDMSQYNSKAPLPGPSLGPVIARRASLTGFVVFDHFDLMARWRSLASGWIANGRLCFHEEVVSGLDAAPDAFARLMRGQTMGKVVVIPKADGVPPAAVLNPPRNPPR